MNSKYVLSVGVLFQCAVLGLIYWSALYPLIFGSAVTLQVRPFDPRDPFMGNYAQLQYDVGRPSVDLLDPEVTRIRRGETVYVGLEKVGEAFKPRSIGLAPPEAGTFLRGRALYRFERGASQYWMNRIEIAFGIERYYASPDRALAIEQRVRIRPNMQASLVQVMVAKNGAARLVDVVGE